MGYVRVLIASSKQVYEKEKAWQKLNSSKRIYVGNGIDNKDLLLQGTGETRAGTKVDRSSNY